MDEQILKKLEEHDKVLKDIYRSTEATRNYFKWTLIISIVVIVVPLIGLVFAIPQLLRTLNLGGLGNYGNLGL